MPDSRLNNRAPFLSEVDVLRMGDELPRRVWGKNLSETGIFLQTTSTFSPGDRLSLRFDVEGSDVHVRAAEVVWVKRFEPVSIDGVLPGVGVRFLAVDPPMRSAIRRFVHDELLEETPERANTMPYGEAEESSGEIWQDWRFEKQPDDLELMATDEDALPELEPMNPTVSLRGVATLEDEVPGPPSDVPSFAESGAAALPTSEVLPDTVPATPTSKVSNISDAFFSDLNLEDERAELPAMPTPRFDRMPSDITMSELDDGERSVLDLEREMEVLPLGTRLARSRPSPILAAGIVAIGIGIGVFLGLDTDPQKEPTSTTTEVAEVTPEILGVADVEADLRALRAKPSPVKVAPTKAPAKAPVAKAEPVLTSTTKAPPVEKTPPAAAKGQKFAVPVEGGRIARKFTLTNPSRLVVDLKGAKYPGARNELIDSPGIAKVRIGRPDADHVRVVVELSRSAAPRDISAKKTADSLVLGWR